MYTENIFYLWRVRWKIFILRRQFTPTPHHEGYFLQRWHIKEGVSFFRACMGRGVKWKPGGLREKSTDFSPLSRSVYIEETFMCLTDSESERWEYIYVGKEIFVWRQNMLITAMISTHCLRKEKCLSGKRAKRASEWDVFSSWPFTGYFVALHMT